jgi:hypothetical protein
MVSPCLWRLSSTIVYTPKILPNGGTAPGKQPVISYTSSGVANLMFLTLRTFLTNFQENFLLADITARVKRMLVSTLFEELSLRSIALAPLFKDTPLTSAASFDVKTGLCYKKRLN